MASIPLYYYWFFIVYFWSVSGSIPYQSILRKSSMWGSWDWDGLGSIVNYSEIFLVRNDYFIFSTGGNLQTLSDEHGTTHAVYWL